MGAAASTKENHHVPETVDRLMDKQTDVKVAYAQWVGLLPGQQGKPCDEEVLGLLDMPLPELAERLLRVYEAEPDQLDILRKLLETAGEDASAVRARLAERGAPQPALRRDPGHADVKRCRALERLAARLVRENPTAARELLAAALELRASTAGPDHALTRATRSAMDRAAAREPSAAAAPPNTWVARPCPCGG